MLLRDRWRLPGLVVLTACACLFSAPLLAAGKLDTVAKFQTGTTSISVDTYTDPAQSPPKVGLIAIEAGSQKNSFAFKAEEWPGLIGLVAKAANVRSGNWSVVGELTEKDTSDTSHMVVSAGPGIRFALNSPKGASVTYVLPARDIQAFRNALEKVRTYLTRR
jgi:hypothetical protein